MKNLKKKPKTRYFNVLSAVLKLVGVTGFEPAAPWSQTKCATKLRQTPTELLYHNSLCHECQAL